MYSQAKISFTTGTVHMYKMYWYYVDTDTRYT